MNKFSGALQDDRPLAQAQTAPPSVRAAKAERRRAQVLDAARVVFRQNGFHGASMVQSAAEAGMSGGHIYRYFENKEAVIASIVAQDMQLARETFDRMMQDPAGMPAAMLAGVNEGVAKMLDRQDAALFMEVMAEAARNPKVAPSARLQHEAALDCVGSMFKDRVADGGRFTSAQAVDLLTLVFSGLRFRAIQDHGADAASLALTIRAFAADLMGIADVAVSPVKARD